MMYSFNFAILVLAATAAVPTLSAPVTPPSLLAARDPTLSVKGIRDPLNNFDLRSEDVSAGLYGRDSNDPYSPLHVSDDDLGLVNSARDDSGQVDSLKRDDIADDIQARGFFQGFADGFTSVFDAAGNIVKDTATGIIKGGEDAVNGAANGFDTLANGLINQ